VSVTFVVNPRSANGATLRRFERVRESFKNGLGDIDVKLTERPRHATELARAAIKGGARAVISVGGDGTNNEVINGFFEEDGSRVPGAAAFGVVTSGTGGDFRRTFGWTTDALDDLARLMRCQTRTIDVGRLTVTVDGGSTTTRHFVNIASFGMSGEVVDIVNHSSKALGAKLSFMAGSVRTMISYRPKRVRLTIDDAPPQERDITVVAVANGQYFGGGMWIAPAAVPDDGLFDCVTVRGGGLSFWVRNGLKVYAGKHMALEGVSMARCRRVRAEPVPAGDRVLVEIDGEQPGHLPATFEVVPASLPLLV
jgi:YegS/Rv2252/BmrU family lipid kinase